MHPAERLMFLKVFCRPRFAVGPHLAEQLELVPLRTSGGVFFGFRHRPYCIGEIPLEGEDLAHPFAVISRLFDRYKAAVVAEAQFRDLLVVQPDHVPGFIDRSLNRTGATKTAVPVVVVDHDDGASREVLAVSTG